MDFRERLQRAAQRGRTAKDEKARAEAARAMSEEECKRAHGAARRELCDHIESCLKQLADNFPGFEYEPVVSDRGWGGAVRRDDLSLNDGRRENLFSRLELTVSSYNEYHVIEVAAKGAVRNKENFTRNHFQRLSEADMSTFRELIEQWTLDYAESYAAAE
ncbi:MAG: hypothetical protein KDA44_23130 [Planctomycetales bacterium]|nr:hypothetical protein [Planctomycetales bacterium]